MKKQDEIRLKALWAMKAVTAGAIFFAGVSCSSEVIEGDPEWNIDSNQETPDVSQNDTTAVADAGGDPLDSGTPAQDTGAPPDVGGSTDTAVDIGVEEPDTGEEDAGPEDVGSPTLDAGDGDTDTEDVSYPGDVGADSGTDVGDSDVSVDAGEADVGPEVKCNDKESTDECPEGCTPDNDVDCCFQSGGDWWGGQCGPMAVPGPFVPPAMHA